jgi:hypothetical protein
MSIELTVCPAPTFTTVGVDTGVETELVGAGVDGEDPELEVTGEAAVPPHPSRETEIPKTKRAERGFTNLSSRSMR